MIYCITHPHARWITAARLAPRSPALMTPKRRSLGKRGREIRLGRYDRVGRLLSRLVYVHRRHEHRVRFMKRSAMPLVDQATGNVVAPRHIADSRTIPKRLRQDALALFIASATPTGPAIIGIRAMVGPDVLTDGCKDILHARPDPSKSAPARH